ncbi:MAG: hypothetical protein M3T49_08915 [Candidatus Eremiobacteraeota bacterium]|nr:hypothetical protein [Candidatus Eremiobacteraeota bacterium]
MFAAPDWFIGDNSMPSVPADSNYSMYLAWDGFIIVAVVLALVLVITYAIAAADRRKAGGD